jgi:hypothetical protein
MREVGAAASVCSLRPLKQKHPSCKVYPFLLANLGTSEARSLWGYGRGKRLAADLSDHVQHRNKADKSETHDKNHHLTRHKGSGGEGVEAKGMLSQWAARAKRYHPNASKSTINRNTPSAKVVGEFERSSHRGDLESWGIVGIEVHNSWPVL